MKASGARYTCSSAPSRSRSCPPRVVSLVGSVGRQAGRELPSAGLPVPDNERGSAVAASGSSAPCRTRMFRAVRALCETAAVMGMGECLTDLTDQLDAALEPERGDPGRGPEVEPILALNPVKQQSGTTLGLDQVQWLGDALVPQPLDDLELSVGLSAQARSPPPRRLPARPGRPGLDEWRSSEVATRGSPANPVPRRAAHPAPSHRPGDHGSRALGQPGRSRVQTSPTAVG